MPKQVKVKKSSIQLSQTTHLGALFYPFIFFISSLYYVINSAKGLFMIPIVAFIFILLQFYFMFYGKKIILSENKIYIYIRNKKTISWNLTDDFAFIDFEQNWLGKFFNYGNLILVNKQKQSYVFYFLKDVKNVYEQIIINHEKQMILLDSSYEIRYKKTDVITDSIDSINDSNNIKE